MSPSLESFVNIKSVIDEIDLWNNTRSSMGFDGDLIHSVASALEPLRKWFDTLESESSRPGVLFETLACRKTKATGETIDFASAA